MCGRFTLTADLERLQERFCARATSLSYTPRYNIAPGQPVLAVIAAEERRIGFLRWGLIPVWATDASIGNRLINARAETVAAKPSFRRAFQKRRCLVLADGFYEWKKEGRRKIPFYITLQHHEPFGFAGLWETWHAPSGETIHSCTIVTTTPNRLIATIHDRMPVILPREQETLWLDCTIADPSALTALLVPYPADAMEAYPVSPLVNSPAHDSPACIAPAT